MGNATASLIWRWLADIFRLLYASSAASTDKALSPPSPSTSSSRDIDAEKRLPPLTPPRPLQPLRFPPQPPLSAETLRLLASFDVDPVRGFLPPKDPLQRLPQPELQEWERLVAALPALLAGGGARAALEALPELPTTLLRTEEERRRALMVLSALASAYVWGEAAAPAAGKVPGLGRGAAADSQTKDGFATPGAAAESQTNDGSATRGAAVPQETKNGSATPKDIIPATIAKPLCAVAAAVGVPPIMAHLSVVLANWRRLNPDGPIACGNLAPLVQFLGGPDEAAFYYVTVDIEARGGPAMASLLEAQRAAGAAAAAAAAADHEGLAAAAVVAAAALAHVAGCVRGMREALMRLPELCDTEVFYRRVRPFLSGWRGNPTLPDGVLYEGVGGGRRRYYGGSAAQSSLAAALDAALGVSHDSHGARSRSHGPRSSGASNFNGCINGSGGTMGCSNGTSNGGKGKESQASTGAINGSRVHGGNGLSNGTSNAAKKGISNGSTGANNCGGCASNGASDTGHRSDGTSSGTSNGTGSGSNGLSNGNKCAGNGGDGGSAGSKNLSSSREFLLSMRDYMPPGHRRFLEFLEDPSRPSVRAFVSALDGAGGPEAAALRRAYGECLAALDDFRTGHLSIVTRYVLLQQRRQAQERAAAAASSGDREAYALDRAAGGKGTGGTGIMEFLKPLRDDVRRAALPSGP